MPVPPCEVLGGDVGGQLGDPRRAARAAQPAALVHGDAARVVAAVFEAAQALDRIGTMLRALTAATIPHMVSSSEVQDADSSGRSQKLSC